MNIDKKANEYWNSLVKPLASKQGLTETAYAVGALDQLNELKPSDKEVEKIVTELYPKDLGKQVELLEFWQYMMNTRINKL